MPCISVQFAHLQAASLRVAATQCGSQPPSQPTTIAPSTHPTPAAHVLSINPMRALSALFVRLLRVVVAAAAAAAAFIYQTILICLCCIIHNSMRHTHTIPLSSLSLFPTPSHFIVLLHNGSSVCAACGSVCLGLERKRLRPRLVSVCVSVCLPSVCVATLLDREYYIERRSRCWC